MSDSTKQLGVVGLTAIVFGSMIGSGIFNIVQNMSAAAGVGAVMIAWVITAVGMLTLVLTFKYLADLRPDLNAGIYEYAQLGFGNYVGFNIAWGYWLCTAFANVAYAVMLNDSLGVFFPELLNHGWASVAFGSALIWIMYVIVIHGIHSASVYNTIISALKIAALFLIVAIIVIFFNIDQFTFDIWGQGAGLGDIGHQVRETMLVTLWCFIGIEGAAMMSARSKKASYVGIASIAGFLLAWVLYALVSVAAFGVMSQQEMSQLENPSVAYLLRAVCGDWAYYFVIFSVIASLFGGWIAWTLICAQVPYEAAQRRIMPKQFLRLNRHGVPVYGLTLASLIMQVFFLGVIMAESVYMAAIEISGMMVLPAYLFSGIFLWKATYAPERYLHLDTMDADRADAPRCGPAVGWLRVIGIGCTGYCLWLIYSGGIGLMLATSLFYLPGVYYYIRARRQWTPGGHRNLLSIFSVKERALFIALLVCGIVSLLLIE